MKKTIIIIALAAILIAGSAAAGISVAAATVKPAGTLVLMETHKDTWTVVEPSYGSRMYNYDGEVRHVSLTLSVRGSHPAPGFLFEGALVRIGEGVLLMTPIEHDTPWSYSVEFDADSWSIYAENVDTGFDYGPMYIDYYWTETYPSPSK